jgi:hypothetical protein
MNTPKGLIGLIGKIKPQRFNERFTKPAKVFPCLPKKHQRRRKIPIKWGLMVVDGG